MIMQVTVYDSFGTRSGIVYNRNTAGGILPPAVTYFTYRTRLVSVGGSRVSRAKSPYRAAARVPIC